MVEAWLLKKLCKHRRVYLSTEGRGLKSEIHVYECVCVCVFTHTRTHLSGEEEQGAFRGRRWTPAPPTFSWGLR